MCIFTTLECFSEVKSWSKSLIQYHSFNESICKERNIKGFSICIIIVIIIILPVCPGTMTCIYCIIITFIGLAFVAQDSL